MLVWVFASRIIFASRMRHIAIFICLKLDVAGVVGGAGAGDKAKTALKVSD